MVSPLTSSPCAVHFDQQLQAFAANAGGEASMSTASKMMKGDESDTHHHHYSINGIDGRLSCENSWLHSSFSLFWRR